MDAKHLITIVFLLASNVSTDAGTTMTSQINSTQSSLPSASGLTNTTTLPLITLNETTLLLTTLNETTLPLTTLNETTLPLTTLNETTLPLTTLNETTLPMDRTTADTHPSPPEKVFLLVFSSNKTFTSSLSDQASPDFRKRVSLTKNQIEPIYRNISSFLGLAVLRFRNGSIITESWLRFASNQSNVPEAGELRDAFKTAVQENKINISVILQSINITVTASGATTVTSSMTTSSTVTTAASGRMMTGMILALILLMAIQS